MLNNGAFRFSYNKQLPANILNQIYTTISNHDNNAHTPTHCNNRNLESNDISVQTAPRRRSSYPTSMRSAYGIERADIDRFPFDSRARMDKADTNGYNDSPHTLRCKRSLQGFTTEPIPCPVEETPDEFPIKARSSSYGAAKPYYPIRNADRCRRTRSHPPNRANITNIRPVPPAPTIRPTRQPPCAAAVLELENRHDPISQHEQSLDSVRARPDKRALEALLAAFTGHHAMHGGYGSPRKPIYPIPFFIGRQPKTNICRLYRAVSDEHPANKKDARRTSVLLTLARPLPDPGHRNASLMSS